MLEAVGMAAGAWLVDQLRAEAESTLRRKARKALADKKTCAALERVSASAIRAAVADDTGMTPDDDRVEIIVGIIDMWWPDVALSEPTSLTLLGLVDEAVQAAMATGFAPVEGLETDDAVTSAGRLRDQFEWDVDPAAFGRLLTHHWIHALRLANRTDHALGPLAEEINHDLTHLGVAETHSAVQDTHAVAVETRDAVQGLTASLAGQGYATTRSDGPLGPSSATSYQTRIEAAENAHQAVLDREDDLRAVQRLVSEGGYVVVEGKMWAGRSAFMTELCRRQRASGWVVIQYYVGRGNGATGKAFATNATHQLLAALGEPIPAAPPRPTPTAGSPTSGTRLPNGLRSTTSDCCWP